MVKLSLLIVVSLMGMTSCAYQSTAIRESEPTPVVLQPNAPDSSNDPARSLSRSCQQVQRDLGRSWLERRYYCVPEAVSIKIKSTYHVLHRSSVSVARMTQSAVYEGWKSAAESVKFHLVGNQVRNVNTDVPENDTLHVSRSVSSPTRIVSASHEEETVAVAVWFAPNIEVLGVQGTQRAHAVLDQAQKASRIYLRGHASPMDRARPDHDQLAVGRAWSIKKFFESHGIEAERITILHRNPEVPSRHVEVMLRG